MGATKQERRWLQEQAKRHAAKPVVTAEEWIASSPEVRQRTKPDRELTQEETGRLLAEVLAVPQFDTHK